MRFNLNRTWHTPPGRAKKLPANLLLLTLLLLMLLIMVSGASSCAKTVPATIQLADSLPPLVTESSAQNYSSVLQQHTRSNQIYDGLNTRVQVSATYYSASWRRAWIARQIDALKLNHQEQTSLFAEQQDAHRQYHQFFLALYAENRKWKNLDDKKTIWQVSLVDDRGQQRILPARIERINRHYEELSQYYPYISFFDTAYLVSFPRSDASGTPFFKAPDCHTIKLRMVSSIGSIDLTWQVEHPGQPALEEVEQPNNSTSTGMANTTTS